ncbi:hypothetical protein BROUX41_004620 [Berkeleyomyces rouxiae]
MSYPGHQPPGQALPGHDQQQSGLTSPISQPYGQQQMYSTPQYQQQQPQFQQSMFAPRPPLHNVNTMPNQYNPMFLEMEQPMQQFQYGQNFAQRYPPTRPPPAAPHAALPPAPTFDNRPYAQQPQMHVNSGHNAMNMDMGLGMGMYSSQQQQLRYNTQPYQNTQSYQNPIPVSRPLPPQFSSPSPRTQHQPSPISQSHPQVRTQPSQNQMDFQFVTPNDMVNSGPHIHYNNFTAVSASASHSYESQTQSQPQQSQQPKQPKYSQQPKPTQERDQPRISIPPPPPPTHAQPKTPVPSYMQTPPQHQNQQISQPIRTKPATVTAPMNAPRTPSVASPTLSIRSSISKRSPSVSIRSRINDPLSLYSCVAEECITTAHANILTLVTATTDAPIRDFQKLIATGLTCLEATLQTGHLVPRQEARVRIRYAQVLYEDTDNLMEAEMTLSKGLTLCDRHRFLDLKYIMQYLLLKILFHRSSKAAMVATDKNISDAIATRHHQWVYVFRLLKASFYMQLGNPADVAAIENLRQLGITAQAKSDFTLCAFAYLLEALALLKTTKQENMHRIQECLAMATKNQLNQEQQLLQIDVLILMVDLACSMHNKKTDIVESKLKALQDRMDEMQNSGEWHGSASVLFIPIKRQGSTAHISEDTASVISPGQPNGESDYIAFSFVTRVELMVLIMTFSGVAVGLQPATAPPKSLEFWKEAMETLDRWESDGVTQTQPAPTMQEALRRANWRAHIRCYLLVISGLFAATHSRWFPVKESIKRLETLISPSGDSVVDLMALYLKGIYLQGTGDLEEALKTFSDTRYQVTATGGTRSTKMDISILATLNRIWILQHPSYTYNEDAANLLGSLAPICEDHPDPEIRTVYNLVVATIATDPPQSLNQIKTSMHASIGGSKMTHNKHCLAIALNVMRSKLFEHVMGEQALKSAKAAAAQAKRGGNLLWVSVAEGMLAQSHEVMGQQKEASAARELAANHASKALGN